MMLRSYIPVILLYRKPILPAFLSVSSAAALIYTGAGAASCTLFLPDTFFRSSLDGRARGSGYAVWPRACFRRLFRFFH
jgi:hypothetical protein